LARIPEVVYQAMQELETPAVLATVDPSGNPNAAYMILVKIDNPEIVLISDGAMHKTRQNILSGSRGSVVFLTKDFKAYQIKGSIKYHTSGPLFEHKIDPHYPRFGVVELVVDEVYEGAEKLL